MNNTFEKIEEILNTPIKEFSEEEAAEMLKSCGILDELGNIEPVYKNILEKRVHQTNE